MKMIIALVVVALLLIIISEYFTKHTRHCLSSHELQKPSQNILSLFQFQ